jgi:chromosome segregation ATPase
MEDVEQNVQDENVEENVQDDVQVTPEDDGPYKAFASKKEHDDYMESALKERLARKDRKLAEEKAEAERAAREKALQDQEDWKRLAEERTQTIEAKEKRISELESVEGERDGANERVATLEKRLQGLIKPQLEQVPELYRPFLADMPVEKQAEWLEKNAEKLGTQHGNGRPAGSRPTGRAAKPPRQESDKEAREAQRFARVSNI